MPSCSVQSVKVLSPLLRQRTLGLGAVDSFAGDEQIQIAVVIVVDEDHVGRMIDWIDAGLLRNIGELAVAQIAE